MYRNYIKRFLDFTLSLFAFIVLLPILAIIAILVKCTSKGPVFFLQERLGKNGKVFKIIKFRTMVPNAENIGTGLRINDENDSRITKVGSILRKTSLDELPQLINIIKGDMSIIGPRPPVTYFPHKYEDYSEIQKERFSVKPGLSGLAQVRVRNSATWDERIVIDLEYVKNVSFILDTKIVLYTILKVFRDDNIYKNTKEAQSSEKEKLNV